MAFTKNPVLQAYEDALKHKDLYTEDELNTMKVQAAEAVSIVPDYSNERDIKPVTTHANPNPPEGGSGMRK